MEHILLDLKDQETTPERKTSGDRKAAKDSVTVEDEVTVEAENSSQGKGNKNATTGLTLDSDGRLTGKVAENKTHGPQREHPEESF